MLPLIKLFLELEHSLSSPFTSHTRKEPHLTISCHFSSSEPTLHSLGIYQKLPELPREALAWGWAPMVGSCGGACHILLAQCPCYPHAWDPPPPTSSEPVIILASRLSSDSVGSSGIIVLGCSSSFSEFVLVILDTVETHLEGFHQQWLSSRVIAPRLQLLCSAWR